MSAATTPDDATTTSPGLAVSTVIGMVLGVLGLFVLVVSYQFMPRKVKPSSPLRALAPPPPKPKPLLTRLRIRCTTLIKTFKRQPSSTPEHDGRQPGTHRPMRSFHLTPERRRQREAMRKKFASSLRLNITVDRPFKDIKAFASPRTPKNPYKRMKDDEESQLGLLKPDTAMISPWSATEDYFARTPPPLFTSSPLFTASPGPMSPPPAYDPNTPLRGSFNRDAARENTAREDLTMPPLPSSSAADLERSSRDDVQSLIQEVQTVIEYTREWTRESTSDPFVVGELDSDDDASDTSSVWDAKL